MKRKLLVLLAMCAFTIAMVPRERRAVHTEEEEENKAVPIKVCDKQTPCAWSVYTPPLKTIIILNITNNYCVCAVGTICRTYEDDTSVSAFVYRCQAPLPPSDDEETDETDS